MGAIMILSNKPSSINSKVKVNVKCDECGFEYECRYDCVVNNFNNYGENKCKKCSRKIAAQKLRGKKRSACIVERIKASRLITNKTKFPKFTLICKFCNSEFVVPYRERDRLYCCRSCQSKSISRLDSRNISKCVICDKEFKHYGERITCGMECSAKYLSSIRIGENNPAFKPSKKRKCLNCGNEFEYSSCGLHQGQERVFCSLACAHKIDLKGNSISGLTKQYPFGCRRIRGIIRKRDNYECQLCGLVESEGIRHHVHHIDYDKNNLDLNNLITLCKKCHNATHNGRFFWEIIFSGMLSGSRIIKKPWGAEIHIVNHNDYCLKYLVFFKDRQFSYHTHIQKKELWHCVYGSFECVVGGGNGKNGFLLNKGEKIEIKPNVIHQLQARKNSILIEVSTRDYKEDSIRLIEGVN